MKRILFLILIIILVAGCRNKKEIPDRIIVAKAGEVLLYLDQIPKTILQNAHNEDSAAYIQNYINKWAKRELMLKRAQENLSSEIRTEIDNQVQEARSNLTIYQYQRQMMIEKMDTVVSDNEMENYYFENQQSFTLNSNIVKALYIKIPVESPEINRIKTLARSELQADMQQLETYCFQFAEKFDDFNEEWISMDRLVAELPNDLGNEEQFLRRSNFYETADSSYIYLISIRDFRLRSLVAPFEYVTDDIKNIILNARRYEFIQALENGIYNDALKENMLKIY